MENCILLAATVYEDLLLLTYLMANGILLFRNFYYYYESKELEKLNRDVRPATNLL